MAWVWLQQLVYDFGRNTSRYGWLFPHVWTLTPMTCDFWGKFSQRILAAFFAMHPKI
jgi:hypothetical protein